MPEWNSIVCSNLKHLDLRLSEREEIVAELASHLEDRYGQFLEQGWSESEAFRLTFEEATPWQELAKNINRAKRKEDGMNTRTKTLWLPGLAAFASASILLMFLQRFVYLQPTLWVNNGGVLVIYFSWWILLPLCGAAGAYLSRRAGGERPARLAASLFPAIVMLCVFGFILPVSIVIERNQFVMQHRVYFLLAMVNWTIIPGVALLLGALPFLRQARMVRP
jgi:hypothetical protein